MIAISSLEKALWIVNRLGREPFEMTGARLAKELGVGRSGIHKILSTLVENGFVFQDPYSRSYQLGAAFFRLGSVYSDIKGIWDAAEPVMKALSNITRETISIGIREGDDAILAYRIESPGPIRLKGKVGLKYPVNAGAIGKCLIAYHDLQRVERLLSERTLEKITPNTITEPEILAREYEQIRRRGYAVSNGEHTFNSYGISAPIKDMKGQVWSCLCIAGPRERFTPEKAESCLSLLKGSADEISSRLGYRGT